MKMNKELLFDEAIKTIDKYNSIFIASHINPDGDNIGSCIALYLALKKLGKKVSLLRSDSLPKSFSFLKGFECFEEYDGSKADLFIILDCADKGRLGHNVEVFENVKYSLNIDHHKSNTNFADLNIVDDKSPSTAEMVYKLITQLKIPLDKNMAEAIYTGISTDTGKFSYDSVTSNTHRIVANLLDLGVEFNKININLYESTPLNKMELKIDSLSTLKLYFDNTVATVRVTKDMLSKTNTSMDDTNGIVEEIRRISGVEVACLLKEVEDDRIKISMRSKQSFDVSRVCEDLGGGGHIRASGCTIIDSIDNAEKIVIDTIEKYYK